MRDDLLVLGVQEAAQLLRSLRLLEELARLRGGVVLPAYVALHRDALLRYLAGRAAGPVDTTTRPLDAQSAHDGHVELVGTDEAARRLGITTCAMRKRCRSGRYMGVARKELGRWMIPTVEVESELQNLAGRS